ncbi:hypothetical protein PROFUN_11535 [Planoprotostelium fungivorum]|uniref:Uncharacterized protein n=1 Tax=Planoprotostelium fungivorum TaxID=1890364 RepID=A0A2P6NA17_9EUKA|nr:hypothetical protein PROFUN_11535 [Planoprotostelium fungivorum]
MNCAAYALQPLSPSNHSLSKQTKSKPQANSNMRSFIILLSIACTVAYTVTSQAAGLATYSHPINGLAGCNKETTDLQVRGLATIDTNGPATGYARFSARQGSAAVASSVTLTCNLQTPLEASTQFQLSNVAYPDWNAATSDCNDQPASGSAFLTIDIAALQTGFTADITRNYQNFFSSERYALSFSATTKTIDTKFTGCFLTFYY